MNVERKSNYRKQRDILRGNAQKTKKNTLTGEMNSK
jgi:hypothetical protein